MNKEKSLDCPLCGRKGVIKFIPSSTKYKGGGLGRLGDYSISHEGGYYDFSKHAKNCKALKDIKNIRNKISLIKSKSDKSISDFDVCSVDFLTFEDYQHIFKEHGFSITFSQKREVKKNKFSINIDSSGWFTVMSVESKEYPQQKYKKLEGSHYPEVKDKNPGNAFQMLRHLLINGEAIKIRTKDDILEVWRWDGKEKNLIHHQRKPTKANILAI